MKLSFIGSGHWGSILIDKFEAIQKSAGGFRIHKVYGYQNIDNYYGRGIEFTEDIPALLSESDAVVIATPPETHSELISKALDNDCHVWIEKPMALDSYDALMLVRIANQRNKILFVDHGLCYSLLPNRYYMSNWKPEKIVARFEKKFSSEKFLNSAWNLGIHMIALAVQLDLPISRFQLKTSHNAQENIRLLEFHYENGYKLSWDLLQSKEDIVEKACRAFLWSCQSGQQPITNGEHGLEVIRLMEWLMPRYRQDKLAEPIILPNYEGIFSDR